MESPDMAERRYAEQRTREFLQTHCANLSMAEQLLRFKFDRTVAFNNIILQILFCCQFSDDFWMGKTYAARWLSFQPQNCIFGAKPLVIFLPYWYDRHKSKH